MFKPPSAIKSSLIAVTLALSAFSLSAHATLTSYTAQGGAEVVYSSVSNVTWTKDANLLGSMIASQGFSTVVNNILSVSPTISNTPNSYNPSGTYTLTGDDFNSEGAVSWFGAKAFINYLNSTSYAGSNQWRLPTITDIGAPGAQFGFNGNDFGYNTYTNGTVADNELTELYYQELGSKGFYRTTGAEQSGYGIKDPNNTFTNEQSHAFWSGTEYAPNPDNAWYFHTLGGDQSYLNKGDLLYAWAVSPGQVAAVSAVPAPAAAWLFATGLPVIGAFGRRRKQQA